MSIFELFVLAIALSMDAFAVSVCKGLASKRCGIREMLTAGIWFGGFQALMPFTGWILGSRFRFLIENFDHWIAFVLLAILGINMIKESFSKETDDVDNSFEVKTMFVMAVATSIDALAVGITFGFLLDSLKSILFACTLIFCVTFAFSAFGVGLGKKIGLKYEKKAEFSGGIILVVLGVKILLDHLFFN